jgi:hypothetical protein
LVSITCAALAVQSSGWNLDETAVRSSGHHVAGETF